MLERKQATGLSAAASQASSSICLRRRAVCSECGVSWGVQVEILASCAQNVRLCASNTPRVMTADTWDFLTKSEKVFSSYFSFFVTEQKYVIFRSSVPPSQWLLVTSCDSSSKMISSVGGWRKTVTWQSWQCLGEWEGGFWPCLQWHLGVAEARTGWQSRSLPIGLTISTPWKKRTWAGTVTTLKFQVMSSCSESSTGTALTPTTSSCSRRTGARCWWGREMSSTTWVFQTCSSSQKRWVRVGSTWRSRRTPTHPLSHAIHPPTNRTH